MTSEAAALPRPYLNASSRLVTSQVMKVLLAAAAVVAGLFCSSAHAVVILPNTTATFQFTSLPLSQPSNIQFDPPAGYLDLGATVLPGGRP